MLYTHTPISPRRNARTKFLCAGPRLNSIKPTRDAIKKYDALYYIYNIITVFFFPERFFFFSFRRCGMARREYRTREALSRGRFTSPYAYIYCIIYTVQYDSSSSFCFHRDFFTLSAVSHLRFPLRALARVHHPPVTAPPTIVRPPPGKSQYLRGFRDRRPNVRSSHRRLAIISVRRRLRLLATAVDRRRLTTPYRIFRAHVVVVVGRPGATVRRGRVAGTGTPLGGRPGHRGRRGAARGTAAGRRPQGRLAARLPGVLRARRRLQVFGVRVAGVRAAMRGRARPPRSRVPADRRPLRWPPVSRVLLRRAAPVHAADRPRGRGVPVAAVAPGRQAGHTAVSGVRRQRGRVRAGPAGPAVRGRPHPRRPVRPRGGRRAGHERVRRAPAGRPELPGGVRARVHDGPLLHAEHQTRVRRRHGRRSAGHSGDGHGAHSPRPPRHGHVHADAVVHARPAPSPVGRQVLCVRVRAVHRPPRTGHALGLGGLRWPVFGRHGHGGRGPVALRDLRTTGRRPGSGAGRPGCRSAFQEPRLRRIRTVLGTGPRRNDAAAARQPPRRGGSQVRACPAVR